MLIHSAQGWSLPPGAIVLAVLLVLPVAATPGQRLELAPGHDPSRLAQAPGGRSNTTDLSDLFEDETHSMPAPVLDPPTSGHDVFGPTGAESNEGRFSSDTPQPTPAQPNSAGPAESFAAEAGEDPIPQPVYQPRQRSSQPLTLAGMLDDSYQNDPICEQQFCDQMWECAGGRCLSPWQRCLRDFRRNQDILWGGNCRTGCCFLPACGNWGCSSCGWGLYGGLAGHENCTGDVPACGTVQASDGNVSPWASPGGPSCPSTGCGASSFSASESRGSVAHHPVWSPAGSPSTAEFTITDLPPVAHLSASPGRHPHAPAPAMFPPHPAVVTPHAARTAGPAAVPPSPASRLTQPAVKTGRRVPMRKAPGIWTW